MMYLEITKKYAYCAVCQNLANVGENNRIIRHVSNTSDNDEKIEKLQQTFF